MTRLPALDLLSPDFLGVMKAHSGGQYVSSVAGRDEERVWLVMIGFCGSDAECCGEDWVRI